MKPQDLDRIRFVTRHFDQLQGLRVLVPQGLIALTNGIYLAANVSQRFVPVSTMVAGLTVAVFLLLAYRMKPYYAKRFGVVERPSAGSSRQPSASSPAGGASWDGRYPSRGQRLILSIGLVAGMFLLQGVNLPALHLSPLAIARADYVILGSYCAGAWIWQGSPRYRAHLLALGALLVALAVPGADSGLLLPSCTGPAAKWIVVGACLLLTGLLDHLLLVRTLGRPVADRVASAEPIGGAARRRGL